MLLVVAVLGGGAGVVTMISPLDGAVVVVTGCCCCSRVLRISANVHVNPSEEARDGETGAVPKSKFASYVDPGTCIQLVYTLLK